MKHPMPAFCGKCGFPVGLEMNIHTGRFEPVSKYWKEDGRDRTITEVYCGAACSLHVEQERRAGNS